MKISAFLFLFFLPCLLYAQRIDTTQDRFLNISYDNDFFSGSDRYYTQGIRIEIISPSIKKSPLSKLLISLPSSNKKYYGMAIEQDGFTPFSIRKNFIQYGERPYCGSVFLSSNLISLSIKKKLRLTTQLDLGMIGPIAKGEQEQKAIHKAIHGLEPLGWQYQIQNDLILNYKLALEKMMIQKKYVDLLATSEVRIGTMYDDAGIGSLIRIGLKQNYLEHLGLTKKYHSTKFIDKFQLYVFAKGSIKTVLYNATLQGGVFNRNNVYTLSSSDIKHIVATGYLGSILSFGRVKIEYTKAFLSPEFDQGLSHKWGHCNLSICF